MNAQLSRRTLLGGRVAVAAMPARNDLRDAACLWRSVSDFPFRIHDGVGIRDGPGRLPAADRPHRNAGSRPMSVLTFAESRCPLAPRTRTKMVKVEDLDVGMIIIQDVKDKFGRRLVSHGQEVTYPLLTKLFSLAQRRGYIQEPICVVSPRSIG